MRARNIKPGFFKNEPLADLPPLVRILFAGLWCLADREGRLEDRPRQIRAEVLPYDAVDANEYLDMLAAGNDPFIQRYEVDGRKYIQICHFEKHQNPHVRESPSGFPAPSTQTGARTVQARCKHGARHGRAPAKAVSSRADSLIPDSLIPDSSTRSSTALSPARNYGEFDNVVLTETEHAKLVDRYGAERTEEMIGRLSGYMASKGKRYRSHYATIVNWARRETAAMPQSEFDFGGLAT